MRFAWVEGACIFLSAFLLFLLEPMTAKRILPWFGGSAAVWITCLVFYQVVLTGGYVYAWALRAIRPQAHLALLFVSLLFLPIGPARIWSSDVGHPAAQILLLLSVSIGLPFLLLSATTPLVQHWMAASGTRLPYAFFALSNTASLVALIAYPLWIEPRWAMPTQRLLWSILFACFVVLCAAVAWRTRRVPTIARSHARIQWLWIALPACGSVLLLATTNEITQNIAPVPLLWVVPLALYLLTFVMAFAPRPLYRRAIWMRALLLALGLAGYAIYDIRAVQPLQISLPVLLFAMFAGCLFCHGELNDLRPSGEQLTQFYICIALGGALGAVFTGVAAPLLFNGMYELAVALISTAALAVYLVWPMGWNWRIIWTGMTAAMIAVLVSVVAGYRRDALVLERNFYGTLRVVQTEHVGERQIRTLLHGTITHGSEFLWPGLRDRPTTYYGPDSGIGIVLRECYPAPRSVGIVGLGAGTLAAYVQPGDNFRFYEINPAVVNIAQGLFYYLRDSRANISIATGDARLTVARETGQRFDVLALDAFSGDAVPVHLLTREAFELYRQRLKSGGTIAFHVSNEYLNLAAVVSLLGRQAGFQTVFVRNHRDEDAGVDVSDWVLVTQNATVLNNAAIRMRTLAVDTAGVRPWTDERNDLIEVLKTPEIRASAW